MARRIRILYKVKQATFSEKLEERERSIIKRGEHAKRESSSATGIERELALTLDHIDRARELHDKLRLSLLRVECYVDTELTHMEQRTPKYSPYRFPEREKFQRRLFQIEHERRRLALIEEEQLQTLQSRLLSVMQERDTIHRWK